jgi:hypothetical protein
VQGTHNILMPERAAELLANHGGPLYKITAPDDRSMYDLPVAPVAMAAEAGRRHERKNPKRRT